MLQDMPWKKDKCGDEHRHTHTQCAAGALLVTFKSRLSVPPYRIENMSSDVIIKFAQKSVRGSCYKWNTLAPAPGGHKMAYALDEPNQEACLSIIVSFLCCTIPRRSFVRSYCRDTCLTSRSSWLARPVECCVCAGSIGGALYYALCRLLQS